jgi:hypothetical protein
VGLNIPAAEYVFEHCKRFASFRVVPSHSAQAVKYRVADLVRGRTQLENMILGFNFREDPADIAAGKVTLNSESDCTWRAMPDLTSLLCVLRPDLIGPKLVGVRVVHDGDTLLLKRIGEEGGPEEFDMYDISQELEIEGADLGF